MRYGSQIGIKSYSYLYLSSDADSSSADSVLRVQNAASVAARKAGDNIHLGLGWRGPETQRSRTLTAMPPTEASDAPLDSHINLLHLLCTRKGSSTFGSGVNHQSPASYMAATSRGCMQPERPHGRK